MEYRIKEYLGRYEIQAKVVTHKTTGLLWWKKTVEEFKWCAVTRKGVPLFSFSGRLCPPPLESFKTLEEAKAMVELFKKGPQYHTV